MMAKIAKAGAQQTVRPVQSVPQPLDCAVQLSHNCRDRRMGVAGNHTPGL